MSDKVLLTAKDVGLCYRFHRQIFQDSQSYWALKSLNFELYEGEKLGVIGRNGTGKSSLMKLLAGIFSPSKGTLKWHHKVHVQLLSLGVGFEGSLTGRENAILNGMLLGKTRRTMLARVEKIKEYSELGDFFEYPVNTYSSGMLTRLGFSVAMESDPDVLLLDELLGVGDASFLAKSEKTLHERFRGNKTVVLVSHSPAQLAHLCTRTVWIENGVVHMQGKPQEVIAQYNESLKMPATAHK